MKKNKRVYVSPEVNGIYVLQSISHQSACDQEDRNDYEIEQKLKEKKEEEDERLKKEEEKRQKELESAREEAYKKGYLDAQQNLQLEVEKLKSEYASSVSLFQEAGKQLVDKRERIWQESELEIIKFIMAVSKKMFGYEMSNDRENVIKHIVKEALSYVHEKKIIAVRLSPEDVRKINTLEGVNIVDQGIKILEDKTIAPGGCIVETDFGNVDSQIETRWEEIQKALLGNASESSGY